METPFQKLCDRETLSVQEAWRFREWAYPMLEPKDDADEMMLNTYTMFGYERGDHEN